MRQFLFLVVLALAPASSALCAGPEPGRIISSQEPGWPQFRGPARDGLCRETGLLKSWPEGGPPLLWKREEIGRGYSAPVIGGNTLYLTGDRGDDLVIFAFGLDGSPKWQAVNGRSWQGPYPGSRSSCTLDKGRLFCLNAHGRLVCLDTSDGKERWAVDVLERFGAPNIYWGLSECLLVDGDQVIVTPGGPQAFLAALNAQTGDTLWKTAPLRFLRTEQSGGRPLEQPFEDSDRAGYAPPLLFQLGTRRLIAGCSARHLFLIDADKAEFVWTHPVVPARWEVIGTMPVLWRDRLVFSAPDYGTRCFQIHAGPEGVKVEQSWEAETDNCHGGLIEVGGCLYGSGYRRSRNWVALDLASGKTRYAHPDLVKGAVLWADERLYALSENGTMSLLEPRPGAFEILGRFELPKGSLSRSRQSDVWAHPVIHAGKLYLRNHDILLCYDVKS